MIVSDIEFDKTSRIAMLLGPWGCKSKEITILKVHPTKPPQIMNYQWTWCGEQRFSVYELRGYSTYTERWIYQYVCDRLASWPPAEYAPGETMTWIELRSPLCLN